MNRRFLTAAVPLAGVAIAVAACGPSGSRAGNSAASAASSLATSSVVASAKADAESLIGNCLPKTNGQYTVPTSPAALQSALKCAEVPKGSRIKVAGCIADDAIKGPVPPAGPDRENAILTWAVSCIRVSQGGAAASPPASPAASQS